MPLRTKGQHKGVAMYNTLDGALMGLQVPINRACGHKGHCQPYRHGKQVKDDKDQSS